MPYFPQEIFGQVLRTAFGEVSVPASVETTLATLVVASGKRLRIRGLWGEGKMDGLFRMRIDGIQSWRGRNSWTERNVTGIIEEEATAGQTIILTVEHGFSTPAYGPAVAQTFSGKIFAYEL